MKEAGKRYEAEVWFIGSDGEKDWDAIETDDLLEAAQWLNRQASRHALCKQYLTDRQQVDLRRNPPTNPATYQAKGIEL